MRRDAAGHVDAWLVLLGWPLNHPHPLPLTILPATAALFTLAPDRPQGNIPFLQVGSSQVQYLQAKPYENFLVGDTLYIY